MRHDQQVLMELANLKNGPLHKALQAEYTEITNMQCRLKDETELRWNQGKQQLLFEMLNDIESARDRLEQPSRPKSTVNSF